MNVYEKNSGMKAPTTPPVEERRAESKNVFFRPDHDYGKDDVKEDGDSDEDDDVGKVDDEDDDDDNLFYRPAIHSQSFQS